MRPIVADRPQFLVADGESLIDDGFPLLPTLDSPHWTVVLAAATAASSNASVAASVDRSTNPAYRAGRR